MTAHPIRLRGFDGVKAVPQPHIYGDRKPMTAAAVQYSRPIGVAVLAELNIVQKYEQIRLSDFGEIAQPGKVVRLMYRDDQSAFVTV